MVDGRVTYDAPGRAADVQTVERLGAARPGRRALPRRARRPRRGRPSDDRSGSRPATDRDAGTLLIRDAGSPGRHPLDRRARGPAADHPGRPAHRPHPPLHPQLRARDRAGGPRRPTCAQEAAPRRRLGQAGRRLDRPRDRRPRAVLARARRCGAAIAAAHAEGARVTAHCFGEDCLPDLLAAGIDCIEHATGLTDATRARGRRPRASRSSRPWSTSTTFPAIAGGRRGEVPGLRRAHAGACTPAATTTVAAAYEAGVPVYVGTDAGGSLPHGLVAARGRPSWSRPGCRRPPRSTPPAGRPGRWLGRPGLDEGARRDLVVYDADPRAGRRGAGARARRPAGRGRLSRGPCPARTRAGPTDRVWHNGRPYPARCGPSLRARRVHQALAGRRSPPGGPRAPHPTRTRRHHTRGRQDPSEAHGQDPRTVLPHRRRRLAHQA